MDQDFIFVIGIAAVILFAIAQVARTIRTGAMHKTLRKAIEQGEKLDPALIERLDQSPKPGASDSRIGLVMVAIALALFLAAMMNPGQDNWRQLVTIALFPLLVGAALLIRPFLSARFRGE